MKWVAPHLTGGLGNRLFEFHAAYAVSQKWNRKCVFFLPMCGKNDHGPFETIFHLYPMIEIVETANNWIVIPEKSGHCFIYNEFTAEPEENHIIIGGWRQSPKYFKDIVLPQPNWSNFLSEIEQQTLREKYNLVENAENTWMLHMRLGDYKQLPHHQIPVLHYYNRCLQEVPKGSRILLFSDEPNLCKEWITEMVNSHKLEVQVCEELDEIAPLWLMSQCLGGAIVTNSTFSWWGAYFAKQNKGQKSFRAYYPDVWGKGLPPAKDVVPEWGIRMPIE